MSTNKMEIKTLLTKVDGYNPKKRMIFSEPISREVTGSKPKPEFKQINISTRNEYGSKGDLIIPTERLYSLGVSENTFQKTENITGYTFPLYLWNLNGATTEEKTWTDTFNKIVDCCIDSLVENRDEIEMFDLTRGDLTKTKGGLNHYTGRWKNSRLIGLARPFFATEFPILVRPYTAKLIY